MGLLHTVESKRKMVAKLSGRARDVCIGSLRHPARPSRHFSQSERDAADLAVVSVGRHGQIHGPARRESRSPSESSLRAARAWLDSSRR